MAFKKDVCRNFQRGSCQYGERCKFLHVNNNNNNNSNFNQQKPNPFGLGSQQNQPSNNVFGFGSQPNKFKPFENKWSRFSPISNANAPPSRQSAPPPENQPHQPANHKCTDPEACKRQILEDFQNERPLWKLTCYAHSKNGPCDIVGDVSYEELRAIAYDEAKRGVSLQAIVERERSLFSSKLIELENLLRIPYMAPSKSAFGQSPFAVSTPNTTLLSGQNNTPPSVSSFSQLGASLNMVSGTSPTTLSNNAFGQPNFSNSSQIPNSFGIRPAASSTNVFPQPNGFPISSQSTLRKNNVTPVNPGPFGGQHPGQASENLFPSSTAGFGNSSITNTHSNPFSPPAMSIQITQSPPSAQPLISPDTHSSASNTIAQPAKHVHPMNDEQRKTVSVDVSIWLKQNWTRGEIPEEAPPDEFI